MELDEHGGLHLLDDSSWQQRRRDLARLGGPPDVWAAEIKARRRAAAEPGLAWHERQAEDSLRSRQWFAALLHLKALIKAQPKQGRYFALRGQVHAEQEQWKAAMADFDKALQRGEKAPYALKYYALACLAASDLPAYRHACAVLLQRFDPNYDAERAQFTTLPGALRALDSLAGSPGGGQGYALLLDHFGPAPNLDAVDELWICTHARDAVSDPLRLVRVMEQVVARYPRNAVYLGVLGRALYRAGRCNDAVRRLEEAIRAEKHGGYVQDVLFLAMAHHRQGNTAKAKTLLNKETTWLDKNQKAVKSWWWVLRVGTAILRREAETLVNDKPGKPEK
jgi:predicted Zn-dependent protease